MLFSVVFFYFLPKTSLNISTFYKIGSSHFTTTLIYNVLSDKTGRNIEPVEGTLGPTPAHWQEGLEKVDLLTLCLQCFQLETGDLYFVI